MDTRLPRRCDHDGHNKRHEEGKTPYTKDSVHISHFYSLPNNPLGRLTKSCIVCREFKRDAESNER